MKSRYRVAALLLLVGMLLACVPVFYSAHQARQQAIREKFALLDDTANNVDRQVRGTTTMLRALREQMQESGDAPCSPAGIARMQRFTMSSQIVKGVLYFEQAQVKCSSGGALMARVQMGPPPATQPDGTLIHSPVRIPGLPERQYVLLEKDGYGLLVYPDGLIAPFARPDLSMGIFSTKNGQWVARHGLLHDGWKAADGPAARNTHYIDRHAGFLVVRRIVPPGTAGAVVAAPLATVDTRVAQFALWFIPAGVLAGLVVLGITWLLSRRQVSPRAELLYAINKGHLFLLYQPVFNLTDNTCIGAEALLRWRQENGTVVSPDHFIPFAEEAGLIQLLTGRVLELVQADMTHFLRQNPGFRIGVNLSPRDLQSARTPELLAAMQKAIGPGCGQFVVEATERGLLEKASALDVVNAIRALGIQIAIDDFGTGYSSLSYLATYPFDILKVDKSFTNTACTGAVTSQVASHIIDLARSLGMQALVEGVETEEQAAFFHSRGVILGQGYLFGKPMRAAELFAFIPLHSRPGQFATHQPPSPLPARAIDQD